MTISEGEKATTWFVLMPRPRLTSPPAANVPRSSALFMCFKSLSDSSIVRFAAIRASCAVGDFDGAEVEAVATVPLSLFRVPFVSICYLVVHNGVVTQ